MYIMILENHRNIHRKPKATYVGHMRIGNTSDIYRNHIEHMYTLKIFRTCIHIECM